MIIIYVTFIQLLKLLSISNKPFIYISIHIYFYTVFYLYLHGAFTKICQIWNDAMLEMTWLSKILIEVVKNGHGHNPMHDFNKSQL